MPPIPLSKTIDTTLILVDRFQSTLSSPGPQPSQESTPDPLPLLRASALSARSHVTKLSLLAITPPFTPKEVARILDELNTAVMPSLLTATLLSVPERFTSKFYDEAVLLSGRVLKTLADLVKSVEKIAKVGNVKDEVELKGEVTATTGRVWEACDKVIALAEGGIVEFVVRKAKEWHSLVLDAVTELEEWDPDEEDEDIFGDVLVDRNVDEDTQNEDKDGDDNGWVDGLKNTRDEIVKLLRAVEKIYPATIKRRLKIIPKDAPKELVERLNVMLASLNAYPNNIDELAGAFYEKDPAKVVGCLCQIRDLAEESVDQFGMGWSGEADEFTPWCGKWIAVVKKLANNTIESPELSG